MFCLTLPQSGLRDALTSGYGESNATSVSMFRPCTYADSYTHRSTKTDIPTGSDEVNLGLMLKHTVLPETSRNQGLLNRFEKILGPDKKATHWLRLEIPP